MAAAVIAAVIAAAVAVALGRGGARAGDHGQGGDAGGDVADSGLQIAVHDTVSSLERRPDRSVSILKSFSDPAAERRLNGAVSFGGRSTTQTLESRPIYSPFRARVRAKTAPRTGDDRLEGDQAMSRNVAYTAGEDLQILSFEVGTQTYCVPVGAVREIRGVTPPPRCPTPRPMCAA
jgi:hypothetical protein